MYIEGFLGDDDEGGWGVRVQRDSFLSLQKII